MSLLVLVCINIFFCGRRTFTAISIKASIFERMGRNLSSLLVHWRRQLSGTSSIKLLAHFGARRCLSDYLSNYSKIT